MSWEDILKRDFLQVKEALKEAQKRANETGKTQFVIADPDDEYGTEYTIHTEDISILNSNLILYEKVEPQEELQ